MPSISTGTPKNLENSLLTPSSQWPSIGQAIGFAFRLLMKMKKDKANPPKAAAIKNKFKNFSKDIILINYPVRKFLGFIYEKILPNIFFNIRQHFSERIKRFP